MQCVHYIYSVAEFLNTQLVIQFDQLRKYALPIQHCKSNKFELFASVYGLIVPINRDRSESIHIFFFLVYIIYRVHSMLINFVYIVL